MDARRRLPTTVGRQPRRRDDDIEEASTAASVPPYEPSCEYEYIRDLTVAERDRLYEATFGVPYPRGQQNGLLAQTLCQPDLGEEEEEVGASGYNGEEVMEVEASGDNEEEK